MLACIWLYWCLGVKSILLHHEAFQSQKRVRLTLNCGVFKKKKKPPQNSKETPYLSFTRTSLFTCSGNHLVNILLILFQETAIFFINSSPPLPPVLVFKVCKTAMVKMEMIKSKIISVAPCWQWNWQAHPPLPCVIPQPSLFLQYFECTNHSMELFKAFIRKPATLTPLFR